MKVLAGKFSSEASLLGLQMATFLLGPHMVFPLCMRVAGVWRGAAQGTLQRRTC